MELGALALSIGGGGGGGGGEGAGSGAGRHTAAFGSPRAGLRYLGVLLMGSLIIIPAATAKHVTRSLGSMLAVAVMIAVASTLVGTSLARAFHRETGPVIIAVAAGVFFLGLLIRRHR